MSIWVFFYWYFISNRSNLHIFLSLLYKHRILECSSMDLIYTFRNAIQVWTTIVVNSDDKAGPDQL